MASASPAASRLPTERRSSAQPRRGSRSQAPIGTPKAALDLLQSEGLKFLQAQATKDRLASLSYDPIGMTTEPFAKLIDQDLVRWQQAVQRTGIKVNK